MVRLKARSGLALLSLLLLGSTCRPALAPPTGALRFALTIPAGETSATFVQVTTPADQPGWIRVTRASGESVALRPRCEIADCGVPPVVCGAAIPIVRDLALVGEIALEWDRLDSVIDPESGCEARQPAPPGDYVATFCYSRRAATAGGGDPRVGVQGSLVEPVCARVPFSLPGAQTVTYRVPR